MLRTMTQCGICPPSVCLNRAAMGIPPLVKEAKPASNNSGMIGGIVGGLVGLGLVVALAVYLYIRRGKKKGQLPFAFTNRSGMSQDQQLHYQQASPPTTPHPGVVAALSHQHHNSLDMSPRSPLPPPHALNTINTPLFNNTNTNGDDISTIAPITTTTTTVPQEFEERIALQNKRISHILNNNPRLSQHQATFAQIQTNFDSGPSQRNSTMTYTTDDDSEYDYEEKITVASRQQAPAAAVQVNRAKPQIMRVNSVRKSGIGLNRSDSVRTIITPMAEDDLANQFPQIPSHRIEDPFQDKKIDDNDNK
ncbi:hypothetical protein INT47_009219 [Mucor saturninus]|uniref:Uncharacterized protein n=1 Tax=Mucor saturninus TaxID=64648 RepID=A0A8H7VAQ9_9FUNG|nr:hypothetical protein INT47_009219 [Mucor saturninus]